MVTIQLWKKNPVFKTYLQIQCVCYNIKRAWQAVKGRTLKRNPILLYTLYVCILNLIYLFIRL